MLCCVVMYRHPLCKLWTQTKRRIVLDLSFPSCRSVNDGIPKDTFLYIPFHLNLPQFLDFVNLILSKGPGSFLYKKDL